jgi:hypothetical protein
MSSIAAEAPRDGYALVYREARMGLEDQEKSVVEVLAWVVALVVQR